MSDKWTQEQDDLILSLRKKNYSRLEIAKALFIIRPKTTKNAVIGRIDRLLKSQNPPKDNEKTFIIKNKIHAEAFDLNKIEGRWDKACSISGKGVKNDDLKPRKCNFPLGALKDKTTHFCGLPVHEKGYCEAHYDICFQKRREK